MITSQALAPVDDRDHVRGAAEARVVIVEYGDFACMHTRAAQPIVDRLLAENPDARLVFRPFPMKQSHPHAEVLARVAEAAAVQQKYWEMHQALMQASGAGANEKSALLLAERLGLDVARLKEDMNGRVIISRVETRLRSGIRAGVQSTPTFFFGVSKLEGQYDYDILGERLAAARSAAAE
jgi:protein-disulfide isomerase